MRPLWRDPPRRRADRALEHRALRSTIFLSAFLLFQVQPLIGKYALPWFGGSAGVWAAALLFFQLFLLLGYAYAHALATWLRPRGQAITHLSLLALALVALPIIPSDALKPEGSDAPVRDLLLMLGLTIGAPYLLLSANGPLLQHWFSRQHAGRSPYRLYALSNVASLLALLTYPLWFERAFPLGSQAWLWSGAYGVFTVLCAVLAVLQLRRRVTVEARATLPAAGDTSRKNGGVEQMGASSGGAWRSGSCCPPWRRPCCSRRPRTSRRTSRLCRCSGCCRWASTS